MAVIIIIKSYGMTTTEKHWKTGSKQFNDSWLKEGLQETMNGLVNVGTARADTLAQTIYSMLNRNYNTTLQDRLCRLFRR